MVYNTVPLIVWIAVFHLGAVVSLPVSVSQPLLEWHSRLVHHLAAVLEEEYSLVSQL